MPKFASTSPPSYYLPYRIAILVMLALLFLAESDYANARSQSRRERRPTREVSIRYPRPSRSSASIPSATTGTTRPIAIRLTTTSDPATTSADHSDATTEARDTDNQATPE